MNDIAIRIDGLSKLYRIGAKQESYKTLRDTLSDTFLSPFRYAAKVFNGHAVQDPEPDETIWALKNISFEVKQGDVVGIIGKNGAGKTTLLKILSRITDPTEGRAEIYGRVGSLLEVGTGFHPGLTGRENVYLNGAILGMTKAEIDRKFDDIVDFAEIEKFIETPVKRYSSGMYVRLAFAVAAHMEPEILIVDEVLAVGDIGFQKKCLGKMQDVASGGRTVLFVSHNMAAIRSLCKHAFLLENGMVQKEGSADDVVDYYVSQFEESLPNDRPSKVEADRKVWFDSGEGFSLHRRNGGEIKILCGDVITLEFDIEAPKPLSEVTVGITIVTAVGDKVISMSSKIQNVPSINGLSQFWKVSCVMGRLPINAGTYFASVYVGDGVRDVARFSKVLTIRAAEHDVFGWGTGLPSVKHWGPMYWAPEWNIRPV